MTEHFIKEVMRTKISENIMSEDKDLVYLYGIHLKDIMYNTSYRLIYTVHGVIQ